MTEGFFQNMNWVDLIFLGILAAAALTGLFRGGVREMMSLLSWLAGYVVAMTFSHPLAKVFANTDFFSQMTSSATESMGTDASSHASLVAVGIIFMLLFSATVFVGSLVGRALNNLFESDGISFLNRAVGILMGMGRGALGSLVVIFIIQLTPFASEDVWHQSKMVDAYRPGVLFISNLLSPGLETIKKRVNPMASPVPLYREL